MAMPQGYGRVPAGWWAQAGFRALSVDGQWLLMMLVSQPDLSLAGTLGINVARWVHYSNDAGTDRITRALDELVDERRILTDFCTQEMVVRGLMDDPWCLRNKNLRRGAANALLALQSRELFSDFLADIPKAVVSEMLAIHDPIGTTSERGRDHVGTNTYASTATATATRSSSAVSNTRRLPAVDDRSSAGVPEDVRRRLLDDRW